MPTYERQLSEFERFAQRLEDRTAQLSTASDKRTICYDLSKRILNDPKLEEERAYVLMSRCDSVLGRLDTSVRRYYDSVANGRIVQSAIICRASGLTT